MCIIYTNYTVFTTDEKNSGFFAAERTAMDLQMLVECFHVPASIFSVQKKPDGSCGEIRIAAVNEAYRFPLEHPVMPGKSEPVFKPFVPGTLYDEYIPKDVAFEDLCFRGAVGKKQIHTVVHVSSLDMWFDVVVLPLECDEGDVCYCIYSTHPCKLDEIDFADVQLSGIAEDVLKTCIRLHDTNDFEQTMKEVISDIRVLCDAAVCTIMLMDTSTGTCAVLATNIKEGCNIKRVTQFVNFYDIALSWIDTIGDSGCLIIKDGKDMEYISRVNNPWYLTLDEAGVDSVVMFPLRYNGELLGFIWATNFNTSNALRIKETLELSTYFISSEVANYKMMKRLEHISYTDLLTGVLNRNAMNNKVSDFVTSGDENSEPFGIVFTDLNGLKRVNDNDGHFAGDLLLKKAAIILQEVFSGDEIFRAGGDEFMMIVSGGSEQEFEQKIRKLREKANDPENVCFAIGSCYDEHGRDIRRAMHIADEQMYRDKEQYYIRYPERKHR